jgi:Zn-dependent peptidase ImmA (M78 family)/transcriptional regulator with XRE-family HTH domain
MSSPTSVNVGLRVKHAREAQDMNQEQLSKALGFNDRQTLSDIETGKRAVKADELSQLSDLLDQDLEFFLDPFSVVAEAQYSWRATLDVPEADLDRFEAKASGWVGMLRWLRAQSPVAHSPLRFTLGLDVHSLFEQAQSSAERLVAQFSLGPVPALKLVKFVESELDIPVLFVDMDCDLQHGSISGAACHLPELGAVLVNRREPLARRNFDLAHEVFHILTWERMAPEHRETNSFEERRRTRRVEQLADNFAAALLMPKASLDALIDPARQKDAAHLSDVAATLLVSSDALGWRLRALGRVDEPTREALARTRRPALIGEVPQLFSSSFVKELHVALDRGRLTARKAARTLGISLADLSRLFVAYELHDPFRS